MTQTVKRLQFNWHHAGSANSNDGCGEDYWFFEVDKNEVMRIEEIEPTATTGWIYLIHKKDGSALRVFNPNTVEYFPKSITK